MALPLAQRTWHELVGPTRRKQHILPRGRFEGVGQGYLGFRGRNIAAEGSEREVEGGFAVGVSAAGTLGASRMEPLHMLGQ